MKFSDYKITTVYAYTSTGNYVKLERVLVDVNRQKLIHCSYSLKSSKDISSDGVDCYVLDIPMTQLESGIEISHTSLIHKLNSKHYKSVQYEDIVLEHSQDFSIFL